jgi:hypothetical protein
MHMLVSLITGLPFTRTVGAPGVQGAGITGMQGIGVKTPSLAAVAAMTVGLAGLLHIPKVGIFTSGIQSVMVAIGISQAFTNAPFGTTFRGHGATPNVHIIMAPDTTCIGIEEYSLVNGHAHGRLSMPGWAVR